MLLHITLLCIITLVPTLELRASIPYGIIVNEIIPWSSVAAVCIGCNIILGWVLYLLLPAVFALLERFPPFNRFAMPLIQRARRRMAPYVEKYGSVGVAFFIGIPLPGSGVYTGSLGAYMLGMGRRKFMYSSALGVLIAGIAITILSLAVRAGMQLPFWAEWIVQDH